MAQLIPAFDIISPRALSLVEVARLRNAVL